jgi:hypothetical protein
MPERDSALVKLDKLSKELQENIEAIQNELKPNILHISRNRLHGQQHFLRQNKESSRSAKQFQQCSRQHLKIFSLNAEIINTCIPES